jgi:hypothetical protein
MRQQYHSWRKTPAFAIQRYLPIWLSSLGISAAAGAFGEGLLRGAPPAPVPQNLTGLGFPLWMKQALRTAIAVATMPGAGHPAAGAGPIFGLGIGGQFGDAERCSRRKA